MWKSLVKLSIWITQKKCAKVYSNIDRVQSLNPESSSKFKIWLTLTIKIGDLWSQSIKIDTLTMKDSNKSMFKKIKFYQRIKFSTVVLQGLAKKVMAKEVVLKLKDIITEQNLRIISNNYQLFLRMNHWNKQKRSKEVMIWNLCSLA